MDSAKSCIKVQHNKETKNKFFFEIITAIQGPLHFAWIKTQLLNFFLEGSWDSSHLICLFYFILENWAFEIIYCSNSEIQIAPLSVCCYLVSFLTSRKSTFAFIHRHWSVCWLTHCSANDWTKTSHCTSLVPVSLPVSANVYMCVGHVSFQPHV